MAMTDFPPPPALQPDWALFLDLDGTLIEIAPTPSAIHAPPGLPALLRALSDRLEGALALVSGRTLANIAELVAPFRAPAAGLHGVERQSAGGGPSRPPPTPGLDAVRSVLATFAAAHPGVLVEDKGLTLALHYRQAPAQAEAVRRAAQAAVAPHPGLALQAGKMVVEVRPAGIDKGKAVRDFMAEPPFAGRHPVFVGDDLTDEHGFRAAAALGGFGVLVGAPRPTAARFCLDDPAAVLTWLSAA